MPTFTTQAACDTFMAAVPGFVPGTMRVVDTLPNSDNDTQTIQNQFSEYLQVNAVGGCYKLRRAFLQYTYLKSDSSLVSILLILPTVSETIEGFTRVTNIPAGQQPVEYQLASCAFELPSDADVTAYNAALAATPPTTPTLPRGCMFITGSGAASDTNAIVSYHHYQIPAALTLGDVAAEWLNLPRFTTIETDTGFYATPGDNSSWKRMGGFTYDGQGITLAGSNSNPSKMPPGGIFATVNLFPSVPIQMASGAPVVDSNGVPLIDYAVVGGDYTHLGTGAAAMFDLYIRVKITRTRPCDLDASSNEIRPYIDIDWDLTKVTS